MSINFVLNSKLSLWLIKLNMIVTTQSVWIHFHQLVYHLLRINIHTEKGFHDTIIANTCSMHLFFAQILGHHLSWAGGTLMMKIATYNLRFRTIDLRPQKQS